MHRATSLFFAKATRLDKGNERLRICNIFFIIWYAHTRSFLPLCVINCIEPFGASVQRSAWEFSTNELRESNAMHLFFTINFYFISSLLCSPTMVFVKRIPSKWISSIYGRVPFTTSSWTTEARTPGPHLLRTSSKFWARACGTSSGRSTPAP